MCTRVVYQGTNATILTGRSMDWKEECRSNLWIFPRGMDRSGEAGNNPVLWKSKYGSVIASAYDICSTDGMNERGLVANLLWLAESSYPKWSGICTLLKFLTACKKTRVLPNFKKWRAGIF